MTPSQAASGGPAPAPVSDETLDNLYEMASTCAIKGSLLRQLIDEINCTRALLREQGWQPIESAPKDGTRVILGWCGEPSRYGFWQRNADWKGWRAASLEVSFKSQPTHWQPLPPPPIEACP